MTVERVARDEVGEKDRTRSGPQIMQPFLQIFQFDDIISKILITRRDISP